jgi:hypothetical protein
MGVEASNGASSAIFGADWITGRAAVTEQLLSGVRLISPSGEVANCCGLACAGNAEGIGCVAYASTLRLLVFALRCERGSRCC